MHRSKIKPWFLLLILAVLQPTAIYARINLDAGLEPTPTYTKTDQLKEKFGKLSIEELQAEAEKGDVTAQHYLAWSFHAGLGTSKDLAAAEKWYRKAAERGF